VALMLDPPLADEVDGLRRAAGDRALTRIAPHLTLISPVNVREADLGHVLSLLREAAASVAGPLRLVLGPPTTFLPDNPVLYLAVAGDVPALTRIRDVLLAGPLARSTTWPWVPHVTVADDVEPERIRAATSALAHFRVTATFDRLVLLEERHALGPPSGLPASGLPASGLPASDAPASDPPGPGVGAGAAPGAVEGSGGAARRRWEPLADAALGPRHIVARGGLELELTVGRVLDPEAAPLLAAWPELETGGIEPSRPPFPLVCVARREGAVVGVGAAWWPAWRGYLGVAVDPACRRQGIGTHILRRIESVLADDGWDGPGLEPLGPSGFYRGRSRTARS
jgi:2'-5' RNA ligase/GNAT superfamily N-acetyltransferase